MLEQCTIQEGFSKQIEDSCSRKDNATMNTIHSILPRIHDIGRVTLIASSVLTRWTHNDITYSIDTDWTLHNSDHTYIIVLSFFERNL